MVAVLTGGGLTGCASAGTSRGPGSSGPIPANLRQVCDHVQDAFRAGGRSDRAQNNALAAELQGMIDVADRRSAAALRPMSEAADAIATSTSADARPALRLQEDRAYRALRRACIRAGSHAWS